jgi:DNA polymerase III epsilon subunit-like protein
MTLKNLKKEIDISKKENKEIIVFSDTETTGVSEEDRIIQIAYSVYRIDKDTLNLKFIYFREEFILAPIPIKPAAAAVHGFWKEDLKGAKEWSKSKSKKELELLKDNSAFICFHNSPFDIAMIEKEGLFWDNNKVIDTLRIARHIYKDREDIESKGLQYLRYFFDFDSKDSFKEIIKDYKIPKLIPHTALSDIVVLIYFFKFLVKTNSLNSLNEAIELSLTPVLDTKISFGNIFKKGTEFKEILLSTYEQWGKQKTGASYLNWAMKNMESLSMDQKFAISNETLELIKENKLDIHNKDLSPMILFAAAFIPEHEDFLTLKGFSVDKQKEMVHASLSKKIETLYNTEKEKSIKLKKDFLFFLNYINLKRDT